MRLTLIFTFLFCCLSISLAENIDSLKVAYSKHSSDSLKARTCLKIGDYYESTRINEAIKWGKRAIYHARKFEDELLLLKVLNYSSTFYHTNADYQQQIKLCLEAMKIAEKNGFHEQQGGIAGNIGAGYIGLEDGEQSVLWLNRSIELKEKYNEPSAVAISIGNLGVYYVQQEEYAKALKYHQKALDLTREIGGRDISRDLSNVATCLLMLDRFEEAKQLLDEAYIMRIENEDFFGLGKVYLEYSWLYERKNELNVAISYADSCYDMAVEYQFDEVKHDATLQLATLYRQNGNSAKAYDYMLESYNLWKDLHQQEYMENLNAMRTKYETDKISSENTILIQDGEIKDLSLEKNRVQINNMQIIIGSAIGGLFILVLMVYFLNKWNKDKRARNIEMAEQKKIVEVKNSEILASINYAKRIQTAILPTDDIIQRSFEDSFVLYLPKDVVAGDFYWLEQKQNEVLFAVADCTGHGVPGALVSVVCNNGLNRSVREYNLTNPGEILDKTRSIVVSEFERSVDEVKDGMDIALCRLSGMSLEYSGAHNPLWIVRNGELMEIKANKQPIGKFEVPQPFTSHKIELQNGDIIYIFTDGYADQFGGEKGKKFRFANLKKLLLSFNEISMADQKKLLTSEFIKWQGEEEQVDDVCIMGIRV